MDQIESKQIISLFQSDTFDEFAAFYTKEVDETVLVIGEEGENILAVTKPRRVIVPFVYYEGFKENIDGAVAERVLALLDCSLIDREIPKVPGDQAAKKLCGEMDALGLVWSTVLVHSETEFHVPEDLPFVTVVRSMGVPQNRLFALPQPKLLGSISVPKHIEKLGFDERQKVSLLEGKAESYGMILLHPKHVVAIDLS
jgi:hypothetical protein